MLYLIMSGLLWGTGGLIGTVLNQISGLSPLAVGAYRLLVGGVLVVGYLLAARRRWPSGRRAWTRIIVIGLLSAQFQGCYFLAISLTSVSLATMITIGAAPVIVQLAGRVRGRGTAITTGLALLGLVLLVGVPGDGSSESALLGSAGLSLLAAIGFAVVTIIGTRPVSGLDDLTATGYAFVIGGAALLMVAGVAGRISFALTPPIAGLMLALGIGPTAVAYTAYFRGLRSSPAHTGALVTLLEPLTSTVLAALILGDRVGAPGIAGALVLAVAVIRAVR